MVFSKDLVHRLANVLQSSMRVGAFYDKRHKVRKTFFAVSLLFELSKRGLAPFLGRGHESTKSSLFSMRFCLSYALFAIA